MTRSLCKICREVPPAGHCARGTCRYEYDRAAKITCACGCQATVPPLRVEFNAGYQFPIIVDQTDRVVTTPIPNQVCNVLGLGCKPLRPTGFSFDTHVTIKYDFGPEAYRFWKHMHTSQRRYNPAYIRAMDNYRSDGHIHVVIEGPDTIERFKWIMMLIAVVICCVVLAFVKK